MRTSPGPRSLQQVSPRPASPESVKEDAESILSLAMVEHLRTIVELHGEQQLLDEIVRQMLKTLQGGGKILLCGNGGSAADAQHLAAELVGRFQAERHGLSAIALTTDTSVLTSIANDYGYNEVFRRQVEAVGCPGDLLIAMSTSGESENVCAAVAAARLSGIYTVAMCGAGNSRLAALADIALRIASEVTARIQEAHLFCGHVLCACVEAALLKAGREAADDRAAGAAPIFAGHAGTGSGRWRMTGALDGQIEPGKRWLR